MHISGNGLGKRSCITPGRLRMHILKVASRDKNRADTEDAVSFAVAADTVVDCALVQASSFAIPVPTWRRQFGGHGVKRVR